MNDRDNAKTPPLNETAIRQIGQKLRKNYDDVVNEPVPDRFAELLDQLEKSERKDGK